MIDLDAIAALRRTVAQRSRGHGLAPVLDRQYVVSRRSRRSDCLLQCLTERSTTNGDVNSWTSFSSLKSMVCVSLKVNPSCCRLGRIWAWTRRPSSTRPSCAEGMQPEKNRSDTTAVLTSDRAGPRLWSTVKAPERCYKCLDLCHRLPPYMHEHQAEKRCQTGDTFKHLMIKVDTAVAKHRCDHGVAPNYPYVVIMDSVGGRLNDDELKRVDDAEMSLANLYFFVARPHISVFFRRARGSNVINDCDQVINRGMEAWLRDRLKRRHIDHCLKIHDGLLPKH